MRFGRFAQKEPAQEPPVRWSTRKTVVVLGVVGLLIVSALLAVDISTFTSDPLLGRVEGGVYHGVVRWRTQQFVVSVPVDQLGAKPEITLGFPDEPIVTVTTAGKIVSTNSAALASLDKLYPVGYPWGSKQFLTDIEGFDWETLLQKIQVQIEAIQ